MTNKLRNLLATLTSLMSNKSLAASEFVLLDEEIQVLQKIMAGISLQDLLISPEKLAGELQRSSRGRISYLKVFEKPPHFNLGIFALKQGCRMPIHNHNGMYGIIKPLLGSGFVYSFTPRNKDRLNKYSYEEIVEVSNHDPLFISSSEEGSVGYLEPCLGNIHTIEASPNSPLVILDLLIPPYDDNTHTVTYFEQVTSQEDQQLETSPSDDIIKQRNGAASSNSSSTASLDVIGLLKVIKEPPDYFCDSLNFDKITSQTVNNTTG